MIDNKLRKGANKIIYDCLKVNEHEKLVIIADRTNYEVGRYIYESGLEAGAGTSLIYYKQNGSHGEDPPKPVISAMCKADCAILATKYSLSNSNARIKANKNGVRIISIPGCNKRLLMGGAIEEDFYSQARIIKKLGEVISNAKRMKITTKIGTDLDIKLCGRKTVNQTALAHEPGTWAPAPNIETAVGPCIDGVDGIMYVDGVLIPGGIPAKPVKIQLEKGKIIKIEGGESAKGLIEFLNSFDNDNMYQIVEVGIGMNRKARISGNSMAEDESQFGTLHLGGGAGATFGIKNNAPSHFDIVIRKPKIVIDNVLYFEDEKLVKELDN